MYPTDTAFGIGCRIDVKESVDRLFQLRKRARTKAVPILVDSIAMAEQYYKNPQDIVRRYMRTYWPGALTIVAPCHVEKIYSPIRGGGPTIGIRMPDHTVARALISHVGVPVIGTSANFAGDPTPYTRATVSDALAGLVDGIVDGSTTVRQSSTVVDCTTNPPTIVRQGGVSLDH